MKPRDVLNGIEEAEWSYWGGNILQGKDGKHHLFVCRWREDAPKGHMSWPKSETVRAVAKNRLGPCQVAEVMGPGHNPEAYRLKDGFHWKVDPGEADMPGIAVSEDGKSEDWYKHERIKKFQDEHGRAIQANFAVIDCNKWEDKANDIHSSKNISIPLTAGRLLALLDKERITDETKEIRVRIAAEADFDPHKDTNVASLRFGAPEEVNFGRGSGLLRTEKDGSDLIAVFAGKGCGFANHNFAGKLLGRTSVGKLLFGYCRLPWVDCDEPILSVRRPEVIGQDGRFILKIEVSNHGQVASEVSEIEVGAAELPVVSAACPALEPYGKATIDVQLPESFIAGRSYELFITTGSQLQQPMVFTAQKVKLPK